MDITEEIIVKEIPDKEKQAKAINLRPTSEKELFINEAPDKEKWDQFIYNHPMGNIFQTSLMFEIYESTPFYHPEVIALEDKSKNILGIISYNIIREPGIKSFFSKRAIITGGPIILDNNNQYAEILLSAYIKKVKKQGAIYTEVRNLFNVKSLHPAFINQKFTYEDHLTIHSDLTKPVEVLEKLLSKGRASNIKRAIRKNLVIHPVTDKDEMKYAFDLIKKTYERINLPCPSIELFFCAKKILKDKAYFVAAYNDDNIIIACRIYLVYKDMIYDWYAATDRQYSNLNAGDLLPWNTMLWAKGNNIKTYDFAGAGKPNKEYNVRDYKLSFGGTLLNFGRYQYIHKPNLYRLGVFGIKIYRYLK